MVLTLAGILGLVHTDELSSLLLSVMLHKVVLAFEFVDEILKCDHLNESYWAMLSCGAVYDVVQGGVQF